MNIHLVFISSTRDRELILAGVKICESRFYNSAGHPAQKAAVGDQLLFRHREIGVFASATVSAIERLTNLTPQIIHDEIKPRYSPIVDGPEVDARYWAYVEGRRNALMLHYQGARPFHVPLALLPTNQWGWVVNPEIRRPARP